MTAAMLTRPQPVRPGTAEQLARIAWHRGLDAADPTELDSVALFLIGPGGSAQGRLDLWENLRDDCVRLWHLITADWDDADLDELTDDQYEQLHVADYHAEQAARHHVTVNRLIGDIEAAIWRGRLAAVERVVRRGTALMDVWCPMSAAHDAFEAVMNSGRPIVDNANDRELGPNGQYDGPRCAADDCRTPVDGDGEMCDDCQDDANSHCTECRREVSRPGLCFDCDVRASYVGGIAPRFGAQP